MNLSVQAFLVFNRIIGREAFEVSVLLQAGGRFIGKTSLGTVAEGQEVWVSLGWDQTNSRFVASSQVAGSLPVLSFIPFVALGVTNVAVPPEFSIAKRLVLHSDVTGNTEAHEHKN